MKLECHLNERLPRLAWLARVKGKDDRVIVEHGKFVEIGDDWIVEGVWDGDFSKGEFHKSENFFGSGVRIEGDKVYFVASSAPVDRLLFCELDGETIVSNSLILLLASIGAGLDDQHDYHQESLSILLGINRYQREFRVVHPRIRCCYQVFGENLVVSKNGRSFSKRFQKRTISSFDQYYHLLTSTLKLTQKNYTDPLRKAKIDTFTTTSKGYDSVAVTCLVKDIGVTRSFAGKRPLYGDVFDMIRSHRVKHDDDGSSIASALGFDVIPLGTGRSQISMDELYFLSANYARSTSVQRKGLTLDGTLLPEVYCWSELSHHTIAAFVEANCEVGVVFTGYHGEVVWDKNLEERYIADDIVRIDPSGINLTEIRLKSGFINVAVHFIFSYNIKDIHKISCSDEMKPWSLNCDYDRPIARRIAETAGVRRQDFGQQKRMMANIYLYPVNRNLRSEFLKNLRKRYNISKCFTFIYFFLYNITCSSIIFLNRLKRNCLDARVPMFFKSYDFYYLMNHWAIETLADSFRKVLTNTKFSACSNNNRQIILWPKQVSLLPYQLYQSSQHES